MIDLSWRGMIALPWRVAIDRPWRIIIDLLWRVIIDLPWQVFYDFQSSSINNLPSIVHVELSMISFICHVELLFIFYGDLFSDLPCQVIIDLP